MILQRFHFTIVIRVILITLTTGVFFLTLNHPTHFFSIGLTAGLVVMQTILLIRYIGKINRDLMHFREAVLNDDANLQLLPGSISRDHNLNEMLNEITAHLSRLKKEREMHYRYLTYIVDQLKTGIIASTPEGKIDLVNRSALKLLGFNELKHLSQLSIYGEDFMARLNDPSFQGSEILEVGTGGSTQQLSMRSSSFRIEQKEIRLLSFHSIRNELDIREMQSWDKLIRVINHEMMNSLSPIVSLTKTLERLFIRQGKPLDTGEMTDERISDAIEGLRIIRRKGSGLMSFVGNIRQIQNIPQPVKKTIPVKDLFDSVAGLMQPQCQSSQVCLSHELFPENMTLKADRDLIDQVLINLVRNALEATREKEGGMVLLKAFQAESGRKYIQVIDNGAGIDPEVAEDIFVPFFSTKEGGSGIGLSLCKQIMKLHGGNIGVQVNPFNQTVFTLDFYDHSPS